MSPKDAVGNRDKCGRCKMRHGGNSHLCPVHGAVSAWCCDPPCNPAEWEGYSIETGFKPGKPPVLRAVQS